MKQIIIVRKDLNMSKGKMAAQVAHASMAFLTSQIRKKSREVLDCEVGCCYYTDIDINGKIIVTLPQEYRRADLDKWAEEARERGEKYFYFEEYAPYKLRLCERRSHVESILSFDWEMYNDWICGSFTKIILEAKNKYQLEKVYKIAEELGLEDGVDFFPIKDNCYTELEPEEVDENGVGRTLTCVGFIPLNDEMANKISKKYQLYHDNKNDIDPWDGEKPHAKGGFVEKYCLDY